MSSQPVEAHSLTRSGPVHVIAPRLIPKAHSIVMDERVALGPFSTAAGGFRVSNNYPRFHCV